MRRVILIVLCLSIFGADAAAQSRRGRRGRGRHARIVTVTGCISEGVEAGCLVLTTLDGKHKYSLSKNDQLEVNAGYRIDGTMGGVDTCMQGPHLNPTKITRLKIHCPTR
jgi:hypothetical protein